MQYQEFIYFDKEITADKNDFYGEYSPLSYTRQKEFLREYAKNCKRRFTEKCLYEKAVSEDALQNGLQVVKSEKQSFFAYKRKRISGYRGWQFYTDRAFVKENTLVLQDEYTFPVPCGKYEFKAGVKRFSFSVKIDGGYYHKSNEGILPTTTARWFELRHGCVELIKLAFTPDGQIIIKDGRKKFYHYELNKIGDYPFDEWFTVDMSFFGTYFSITYQGQTTCFAYNTVAIPDTLFFSGGMQPATKWEIKPLFFENEQGEVVDLFQAVSENVGEEILVLKRKFTAKQGFSYTLDIGALDPSGDVFVNGRLALHTDNFQPCLLDITSYVIEGENELVLEVYPRAPEVLYPWHRHNDYYNGWFALDVNICEGRFPKKAEVFAYLTRLEGVPEILVEWDAGIEKEGLIYHIIFQKIFPDVGESRIVFEGKLQGEIKNKLFVPVELWSVENPTLYKVKVEIIDGDETALVSEVETGFRLIEQKQGAIYLNGKKTVLKGGLNMQFLPPYEEIPINHLCPSEKQIVEQVLAIKGMNGNCMRMHQLGYGCNDRRFARICDRLGILLIWTTRLIDSAENMMWSDSWKQKRLYQEQMRYVRSSPSIIIWEGSNELHTDRKTLDRVYDEFVTSVLEVDTTRLLSPVSHLYYGGGIYDYGCEYYNTTGEYDEWLNPACSSFGWKNEKVVRSAHTYDILLGYGSPWRDMVEQKWQLQPELFEDKQKAYLVSEYAIIGRQNPETKEAKTFINKDSYELPNEASALGKCFEDDEWELSQAFQALCADVSTKQLLRYDADGMLWCCMWGGANNASYLKPIIDFHGYKKMAYYSLQQAFQKEVAFNEKPDVLWGESYKISPMLFGLEKGERYILNIKIACMSGKVVEEKNYPSFIASGERMRILSTWEPNLTKTGYYTVNYSLERIS